MKKVLIIEDDRKIANLVRLYLDNEHIDSVQAFDGPDGLAKFRDERPDLIVLDLGLPGIDGIEVARTIRHDSNVPILMLTARSEEIDKVLGLEIGADDYLTKPFSPKELIARIKAIYRRIEMEKNRKEDRILHVGDLEIDPQKFQVSQDSKPIRLSALEFRLLHSLASRPGIVFSREKLMEKIYDGDEELVLDRTIDVHIKNIRKKLGDDPRNPMYIESVFGVGYRFVEANED